jgi:D-methionine transport system ATP-binding protein
MEKLPSSRVLRLAFDGGSAHEPLIAALAIDHGIRVNILGADTRNIDGKAFGTMLLGLPEEPEEAARAIRYLKAQKHVTVEEVGEHHG